MSLALGKTLQELRSMPLSDYQLYQEYYRKQPFGQWRQDYNSARVAQAMAGGKLEELMPFWYKPEPADVNAEAMRVLGLV